MIHFTEDSVTSGAEFDGASGTGLLLAGQGATTANELVTGTWLHQVGFYADNATSLTITLKNDDETPVTMETLESETDITTLLVTYDPPIYIPPNWTVQAVTTDNDGAATVWAMGVTKEA